MPRGVDVLDVEEKEIGERQQRPKRAEEWLILGKGAARRVDDRVDLLLLR